MECGRRQVGSKLSKDAEYVSEREPLVCPISASVPQVNDIDVPRKSFAGMALLSLKPKHFGESECLNPSIPGVSGDICRTLEFGSSFLRARGFPSQGSRIQRFGDGGGRSRIGGCDVGVSSKAGAVDIVAHRGECHRSHIKSVRESGG
jgi:hypothetical protein